ncbi:MAG TPA: PAS domain-containing protein [Aliidongia sp.]|nr:PAS domain-containing protein [Aliidongia sp.]
MSMTSLDIAPRKARDRTGPEAPSFIEDFGPWTQFRIPEDRSGWNHQCRRFYQYWLDIAPPGRLPGRQHVSPGDIVSLLPRVWMLDVVRAPLRFRYRLVGTGEVATLGLDATGHWLDEVHPESVTDPALNDRYRFMVETGRPTWRRGPVRWGHDKSHRLVENCMVPLAADGRTVDIIFAFSMLFHDDGTAVLV